MADILGSLLGGQGGGMDCSGSRQQADYVTRESSTERLTQPEWATANRPRRSRRPDAGGRSRRR
jgi:hypothetical protein